MIYDSLHQRWVAIEASFDCYTTLADVGTGYIDIAISDGPDPTLGLGRLLDRLRGRATGLPGHRHLDRQGRRELERL